MRLGESQQEGYHGMANLHAPGWVAGAVRQGLSGRAGLAEFRANGGSIRDSVWFSLYSQQKAVVDRVGAEITAPLNAVPVAAEIEPMTTKRATGFLQTMDIYTRLKGTDIVVTRPFMLTTDTLMSRGDALSQAMTTMQQAVDEERYEEVLLGGVYTGTRIMTPGALT